MRTVREDLQGETGTLDSGVRWALELVECQVWKKWDQLKRENRLLRLASGLVEGKVLRPILGDRPAGCQG